MKRVVIGAAVGVLSGVALFASAGWGSTAIEDTLIAPGRSIGDVQLGKPVPTSFLKLLPAPNDWTSDFSWGGSSGTDEPVDFFIHTQSGQRRGVVTAVGLKGQSPGWPAFRTKEGIGIGSSLKAVKRAYPNSKWLEAGMDTTGYWQLSPGTTTFGFYGDYVCEVTVGKFE